MVCKICGTELEEGAVFCHECGERVTQQNLCQNCGKDLPVINNIKYCPFCGTSLETDKTTKTAARKISVSKSSTTKKKVTAAKKTATPNTKRERVEFTTSDGRTVIFYRGNKNKKSKS